MKHADARCKRRFQRMLSSWGLFDRILFGRVLLSAVLLLLATGPVSAAILSVRLIKATASRCTAAPLLEFPATGSHYSIVRQDWYNGENDWEIFFEISTTKLDIPLEEVVITAPGVTISRAVVGRTDVPFTRMGDHYRLTLVNDTADGRHVQTSWQNPRGGPHLWIYHNWKDRVNGDYAGVSYPARALAASLNYALAAQEMLRLMGDMSGLNQRWFGELILLNNESSAPRAHLDFPPHWHLEHWEDDYNIEYGIDWRRKQYIIPHFYLDSAGNVISNKQSIHQNNLPVKLSKKEKEFGFGDTCTWKDVEGDIILRVVIEKDGLHFVRPDGKDWILRPDKAGADKGVWIWREGTALAKVLAGDDGEKGMTRLSVEYYDGDRGAGAQKTGPGDRKTGGWTDSCRYDPFTGKRR